MLEIIVMHNFLTININFVDPISELLSVHVCMYVLVCVCVCVCVCACMSMCMRMRASMSE